MTRKILALVNGNTVGSALLARLAKVEGIEITTTEELHRRWSSANLLEKANEYTHLPSYWDNFMNLRRDEVNGYSRIPPKKATCSPRRKGRRFKG